MASNLQYIIYENYVFVYYSEYCTWTLSITFIKYLEMAEYLAILQP